MKLLLRETVDQLGTIGDVVNVPDGFGRNFLLPRGIALPVTPENIRRLEAKKVVLLAVEAKKRDEAMALADRVKAKQVTITAKAAGEEGKLYGSVTTQAIAEQFAKDGLPIEARMILLDQPIKELGVFDVRLRLFPQVEVEAKVWVVEESTGEAVAPAQASAEKAAAAAERPRRRERPAEGAEGERKPRPERAMAAAAPAEKETAKPAAPEADNPVDAAEALVPVGKKKQKRAAKEAEMAAAAPEGESDEAGGKGKKGKKK
jgi:large subunit ribosomal protein L9